MTITLLPLRPVLLMSLSSCWVAGEGSRARADRARELGRGPPGGLRRGPPPLVGGRPGELVFRHFRRSGMTLDREVPYLT
ncbi:hypothetical protein GCM10010417_06250 [Streptomyces carpaticus]